MRGLIQFFASRSFTANIIMFGLIIMSILAWDFIGKEEYPDFAVKWVRVIVPYPGASSEDVERFVVKPVEEKLKGLSGLREVSVKATFGIARFSILIDEEDEDAFAEKYQEIKNAVEVVELPDEVKTPGYERFTSANKAIIDIALYLDGIDVLSDEDRARLHQYALSFKNELIALEQVSGVGSSGYIKPELQIEVDPQKIKDYEIPMALVANEVRSQHLRVPLGVMRDKSETEVSFKSLLDEPESIENAVIRSSFQGQTVLLKDVAKVTNGFARNTTITKVQGHEAVTYNVRKSSNVGILEAREVVLAFVDRFKQRYEGTPIRIKVLDDESYDIRNRLQIIMTNGFMGFLIILLILFLFLDARAGFWVAMGLPFSLAFTLICILIFGYTINNVTLASVIIVLGIVVDDAIIVADSIAKRREAGLPPLDAAVDGTRRVLQPVIAGVLTTCVAFLPMLFFEGRFGMFVKYIPLVVSLMLLASLIESFFILPAHLQGRIVAQGGNTKFQWLARFRQVFLPRMEATYSRILDKVFQFRILVLLGMLGTLLVAGLIFTQKMKFNMFPRAQSKEFSVKLVGPDNATRFDMAELSKKVEDLLIDDKFGAVVGFRTIVGQSRRGGEVQENEANLRVEVVPASEQEVPLEEMKDYWEAEAKKFTEFQEVRFLDSWWGSESGSPIAIEVLENNDAKRESIVAALKEKLEANPTLANVEVERPKMKKEYALGVDMQKTLGLGIDPMQLATTMRSYLEGTILYQIYTDEEVDVRITSSDEAKRNIDDVLGLSASNREGYMVPIKNLVNVQKQDKPANIQRVNYKRATYIYADFAEGAEVTPLEIADQLEEDIFPVLLRESPSTQFDFRGEIEDARESGSSFKVSILLTLGFIYIILMFMFSSVLTPLLIAAAIPFGAAGVIIALWAHGMTQFGFFSIVGTIGMLGVVINDSIVMLDRFESELASSLPAMSLDKIRDIAVTRLRPVILTTLTTVAGVFPTAYGLGGYDAMLADMMLSMGWGLVFGTTITLILMPIFYSYILSFRKKMAGLQW